MHNHVPPHAVKPGQEEGIRKLNQKLEDFRNQDGRTGENIQGKMIVELFHDSPLDIGSEIEVKLFYLMNGRKCNLAFPDRMIATAGVWSVDEGAAKMLTGFVEALQPKIILETGTNRGRSTRALADGISTNGFGRLFTVDLIDYKFDRALKKEQYANTTQLLGESPGDLEKLTEDENFGPIDFAFLDSGHEYQTLLGELDFVNRHAAKRCWILCDNSEDEMWGEGVSLAVKEFCEATGSVHLPLGTMCGMELVYVSS